MGSSCSQLGHDDYFPVLISPDGLLRRYIAMDVPAASRACFEKPFIAVFKICRFFT